MYTLLYTHNMFFKYDAFQIYGISIYISTCLVKIQLQMSTVNIRAPNQQPFSACTTVYKILTYFQWNRYTIFLFMRILMYPINQVKYRVESSPLTTGSPVISTYLSHFVSKFPIKCFPFFFQHSAIFPKFFPMVFRTRSPFPRGFQACGRKFLTSWRGRDEISAVGSRRNKTHMGLPLRSSLR